VRRQTATFIAFALIIIVFDRSLHAEKKLIEFGWDEPDTRFLRDHISEMEQTPFDGCVFSVVAKNENGSDAKFTSECWGRRKFTEAELKPALDDLKATHFKRFKDCFLRFNVTPGDVDWFDDFSAITSNARLAAKLAREGGAKGILLDVEPYNAPLFNYAKMRDAKTKPFDAYAAQARKRGQQLMEAFQKGYPNVKIFLTFGFTLSQAQLDITPAGLPHIDYGLLPALLNGMLDTARGKAKIIDGFEISYGYKDKAQFDDVLKIRERSIKLVANRNKYGKYYAFGFGLWMDMNSQKYGWNTKDITKNYFTPEAFEKSVRIALERSDEYVWIYTEAPKWWSAKGKQNVPAEYEAALRRAHSD
jgi:hypothetical protein